MGTCDHGLILGQQSHIVAAEIVEAKEHGYGDDYLLEFYSACDCCDVLMHKSTCGEGYQVMDDGQTLCVVCIK